MLPFDIPEGTTIEGLLTEIVPKAHASLVPASAGREPFTCAFEVDGAASWIIDLSGPSMNVRAGDIRAPDARLRTSAEHARAFLDDWCGRSATSVRRPSGDMILLSDPRLLKRLRMVTGAITLTISDFPIADMKKPVSLSIAVGAPAKKVEPDADVVIETTMRTYGRLLAGEMGPEDALADGDVKISGKRLVAMQFALAIAPLFPRL